MLPAADAALSLPLGTGVAPGKVTVDKILCEVVLSLIVEVFLTTTLRRDDEMHVKSAVAE